MTTPFEFGAGYQAGSSFVSDQDGLVFFELRKESADSQTVNASSNDKITWTKMYGDGVRASLVATNTDLTPPQAGVYRHTLHLELTGSTGGTAEVTLVGSDGSIYQLWKGPVTTTALATSPSVVVPVIAVGSPLALPTYSVKVAATTANVTIGYGNDSTTRKGTWQIEQLPMAPSTLLQTLP